MQFFKPFPIFLGFLIASMWALSPGPDTHIVDENKFYRYGYDETTMKAANKKYKYRHSVITSLESLINLEWHIYSNITKICQDVDFNELQTDNFTQSVLEYLEDFRTTSLALVQKERSNRREFSMMKILTTNIITPFLAIRRFRNYIRPWITSKNAINPTSFQDAIIRYIKSVYQFKDGPFAMDFQISMLSILLPHFTYDLQVTDIANGNIRGFDLGITLKACHCLEIGVHGIAMDFFPLGIEWLEVAVDKIKSGDDTADLSFAVDWLAKAIKKHDKNWKPIDSPSFQAIYFSKPLANLTNGEERRWRKQITCKENETLGSIVVGYSSMPWHLHWSVCKGDRQQDEKEKSKLFCWYERKVHPVWTIGPLKAEFISRFPLGEVVQFYDLVNDDFMRAVRTDPRNSHRMDSFLDTANLPNPKSYLAAVYEIGNESLISKIDTIVEIATGLRSRGSIRGTQTVSYVPGGHSLTHEDWYSYDDKNSKYLHVMATFMLYIEQPEEGGETSYARSLVKTNPLKGSAVFSFNLLRSGRQDYVAPHGACPLIFGSKWVTKDLIYNDQTQLSCGLHENLRQEILVNGRTKYLNVLEVNGL